MMSRKDDLLHEVMQKKYAAEDKLQELEEAKDFYREELVNSTITDVLNVLKEDGKLTERDMKLFLGDLALKVKQLYSR